MTPLPPQETTNSEKTVTSRGPIDWDEDPIDDLARELRETVGGEFRIEAAFVEIETEIGRLRKRTLADAARESANRGDTVSVLATGRTITGTVVHVGRDYLTVETQSEVVDARLTSVITVVTPSRAGGRSVGGGSVTFRARLAEFEQTHEAVTLLIGSIPHTLTGVIEIVAEDHVILVDSDRIRRLVPTERIDLTLRSRTRS